MHLEYLIKLSFCLLFYYSFKLCIQFENKLNINYLLTRHVFATNFILTRTLDTLSLHIKAEKH